MGIRRKLTALGGALAGLVGLGAVQRARSRARLRQPSGGVATVATPSAAHQAPPASATSDEAHAPGHRHLPLPARGRARPAPARVPERPFAKHRRGLRHPGRG